MQMYYCAVSTVDQRHDLPDQRQPTATTDNDCENLNLKVKVKVHCARATVQGMKNDNGPNNTLGRVIIGMMFGILYRIKQRHDLIVIIYCTASIRPSLMRVYMRCDAINHRKAFPL